MTDDDNQDTGAGAAPSTAQHLDPEGNVDFVYRVDPDTADAHTEGGARKDPPPGPQDDLSDTDKISDSGEFDFALGEIPPQAVTDHVFSEMMAIAPVAAGELKTEWGNDAPKNMAFAYAAVQQVVDPDVIEFFDSNGIDGVPLSQHPVVWRLLARVGRLLAAEPGNPASVRDQPQQGRNLTVDAKDKLQERVEELHRWQFGDSEQRQKWLT